VRKPFSRTKCSDRWASERSGWVVSGGHQDSGSRERRHAKCGVGGALAPGWPSHRRSRGVPSCARQAASRGPATRSPTVRAFWTWKRRRWPCRGRARRRCARSTGPRARAAEPGLLPGERGARRFRGSVPRPRAARGAAEDERTEVAPSCGHGCHRGALAIGGRARRYGKRRLDTCQTH
jgi:hypothetical protein